MISEASSFQDGDDTVYYVKPTIDFIDLLFEDMKRERKEQEAKERARASQLRIQRGFVRVQDQAHPDQHR